MVLRRISKACSLAMVYLKCITGPRGSEIYLGSGQCITNPGENYVIKRDKSVAYSVTSMAWFGGKRTKLILYVEPIICVLDLVLNPSLKVSNEKIGLRLYL